ncbi:MAG: DNA-protecting protein DprA, partial [Candidatus Stahlbacteria bacterium]|nr:DNA-protecting protein DprA [Candidatus Stahlbacteria bacterium]
CGMARGIDSCGHQGALKSDGRTIAVLGCGIDIVYPPENRELMHRICEHGACISEFPLGMQPFKGNFPARNRLISGLSLAIIVAEASEHSGIFSTVEWALEQNREVFAVPGNITSETSKGVNRLIKDGAQITTSAQEVMEYMGIKPITIEQKEPKLSEEENKIWKHLSHEPIQVDKLAETLNLPVQKILSSLLNLELHGIVKQIPGRNFVKHV